MAHLIIRTAEIYAVLGACVAAWFVVWAIARVDRAAHGAFAFRVLLLPGLILLWPLIILRYRHLRRAA